jgi:Cellulose binding domain
MVPTDEPTPSGDPSVSPSLEEPHVKPSASSRILLSPEPVSPSRSQGSLTSALTASVAGYSSSDSKIVVSIKLRNSGAGPVNWTVDLTFSKDVQSDIPWNAKVQAVDSRHLRFTSVRALGPGDEVTFGFIASFNSHNQPRMVACTVDGRVFSCATSNE